MLCYRIVLSISYKDLIASKIGERYKLLLKTCQTSDHGRDTQTTEVWAHLNIFRLAKMMLLGTVKGKARFRSKQNEIKYISKT